VELAERRAARIIGGQFLHGTRDVAAHALDSWCHAELCGGACNRSHDERDAPNAGQSAVGRPIERESHEPDHNPRNEEDWQHAPDESASQRSRWENGEGRRRDDRSQQHTRA
jgi:hypothetical protein